MRDLGDVIDDLSNAAVKADAGAVAEADADEEARADVHLYSALAPVYDFVYERHFDYDEQCAVVAEVVPDAESVLEVGCGTGHLLARLAGECETAVGMERSEAMARRARARTDDATIIVGDATDHELGRTFDAVVALGRVTGHVVEDADVQGLLENCRAHLDPGGVLLFDYFPTDRMEDDYENRETFESDAYRVDNYNASTIDPERGLLDAEFRYEVTDRRTGESVTTTETMTLRTFTHDEIRHRVREAGFAEVETREDAADGNPVVVARKPRVND